MNALPQDEMQRKLRIGANYLNELHDPNKKYKEGDVVNDSDHIDDVYIAVKDTPGDRDYISLGNTEYWLPFQGSPDNPKPNYDLQLLLRTSVPYDPVGNYLAGAVVKLLDDEGEPQSFYCALKFVDAGTNIQDTNAWGPLGYMKGGVLEIPTREAVNGPLSHDPNRFYYAGHLAVTLDEYGFSAGYLCFKTVPADQDISITNKEYWIRTDQPKPPINYMVGAAAILFNPEGKVIVGERVDYARKPIEALFGGKPECDETLAEGLAREVAEEIGLTLDPSRYVEMGIVEASPGRGFKCITGYFAARLTWEEVARIQNLEPHKCFALHWRGLNEIHTNPLWQNPTSYICKAYRFFFL